MNTPHNGNRDPMPGDRPLPDAVLAAMHRDPDAFLDFIRALDRVRNSLRSAGEQPFTPCTLACPLCYPVLWPNETC